MVISNYPSTHTTTNWTFNLLIWRNCFFSYCFYLSKRTVTFFDCSSDLIFSFILSLWIRRTITFLKTEKSVNVAILSPQMQSSSWSQTTEKGLNFCRNQVVINFGFNKFYFTNKQEINELLEQKFQQSRGKLCNVFAPVKGVYGFRKYCCLLCSTNNMGVSNLISHAKSKKHKQQRRVFTEQSSTRIQNIGRRLT